MTIDIPAGTSLRSARFSQAAMYVADDSTADIVDFDIATGIYTVKFEDGEEYTITRAALMASTEIHVNPGNNIVSRNGVRQPGSISNRKEQS
jgi:hypothetical protein